MKKYFYTENILKATEGGMGGSTLKNLNKYIHRKYKGRLKFSVEHSPYVGYIGVSISASDKKALKYGLKLAQNYGYFQGVKFKDVINQMKYIRG